MHSDNIFFILVIVSRQIASHHMMDMGGSDHIAGQKARDRLRD